MIHLVLGFVIKIGNILKPLMLKRIKRSNSFVWVNYQQLLYQIYDLLRTRLELCVLEMEVAGRDLIEHFIPILSLEW